MFFPFCMSYLNEAHDSIDVYIFRVENLQIINRSKYFPYKLNLYDLLS